ncbi:MAG: 1,4-dihydroxy-6-naphthoate synthase [Planctomycetota bacterium]|nr:1,4-dihydroxy-6-naphthoate synthase [Planctomycetota bacterium]
MRTLHVGLSPCPNDTFIFHALLSGLVETEGLRFVPVFEDVEKLNQMARERRLEVTKISFHAYGHLRDTYQLLGSGAALGRGCGPLIVCRPENRGQDLRGARIAIPGRWTSATLLLLLYEPGISPDRLVETTFDRILGDVASGDVDAGLIIHESRFTYAGHGLVERQDLGAWWEETEGLPIPLGGIIADRRLGRGVIEQIDAALGASVLHARQHPDDSADFVRAHAQELDDEVTRAHIDLYVNDFTVELGQEGATAVEQLLRRAEESGVIPRSPTGR